MRKLTPLTILALVALASCATGNPKNKDNEATKANKQEQATRNDSYVDLITAQPSHTMTYSPTRETMNAWVDTWNQRGQLSFVYLLNSLGEKIGYFVFVGPPVSYCVSLAPDWQPYDYPGDSNPYYDEIVPAPDVDGGYYSGCSMNQFYGVDATTGAVIDFSAGGTLNYLSSTQPLDLNVPPLGFTEIADLDKNAGGEYVLP